MKSYLNPTRGKGFFEPLLARLRAKKANEIIPKDLRNGRILDIGCGSYPYFLSHTSFREKFAIDKQLPYLKPKDIQHYTIDIDSSSAVLPFPNNFFQVITLLAVIEHLDPTNLTSLLSEVQRILSPGGVVIITTPSAWSSPILNWMAKVNLVSAVEIREHKFAYTLPLIGWYFGKAGFEIDKVRFGYFELMLNMWGIAEK